MSGRTLMIQGTASSAGKSLLVTALCRIFRQDGVRVAPFKAQNMALNSYVTRDGGEMGRAQVVQAEAAGLEPTVTMNPILLKPETDSRSQVIVRGKPVASLSARDYFGKKMDLWPVVAEALDQMRDEYELVILEGAGSPAEINLRDKDIVNMRVARYARTPVLLVGDIDRGGVFASLLGTLELLLPEERDLVKGLVINKFRGDVTLLQPGLNMIAERTGVPVLGVVPYVRDVGIAEEDSVALDGRTGYAPVVGAVDVAVIRLPHISNFDDFDPLERESDVGLRYVEDGESLGQPDLVILPGTKTTVADLRQIRESGLANRIAALAKSGTPVIGICGGYQMLGERLLDPEGVESREPEVAGLGLLPITTTFSREKRTCRVEGMVLAEDGPLGSAAGERLSGYEIHMGFSAGRLAPAIRVERRSGEPADDLDGGIGANGLVAGTYVHGLFANDGLRRKLLTWLAERKGRSIAFDAIATRDAAYDRIADVARTSLDLAAIRRICGFGE